MNKEQQLREEWLEESSIGTHRIDGTLYSLGLDQDWGNSNQIADYWLSKRKEEIEGLLEYVESMKFRSIKRDILDDITLKIKSLIGEK